MSSEPQPTPNKKYRGINVGTLEYFVKDTAWKINPEGHLPKYADEILKITEDFAEKAKALESGEATSKELIELAKKVNRDILKLALVGKSSDNPKGFDFDEAVERFGWKVIDGIVLDLKSFLVDHGGKDEWELSKLRYKEAKQNGYLGFEV